MHYKRTTFFLTTSILFLFSCAKETIIEIPVSTTSDSARKLYKKAIYLDEQGQWFEKIALLDSAILIDPKFALAHLNYNSNDPIKQKEHLQKAVELKNSVTKSEKLIIETFENFYLKNLDFALEKAKELVKTQPNSYEAYNTLGFIYSVRDELLKAEENFLKAINLNSNNYFAHSFLFGQHVEVGDYFLLPEEKRNIDIALKHATDLIKIRPNAGMSYHLKANCYRKQGEFDKARPLYEKAIEKRKGTSSEANAYLVSGHNYMFGGNFETARKQYDKAIKVSKHNRGKFQLGNYVTWSYLFNDDYTGALKNIDKVEKNLKDLLFEKEAELNSLAAINWQRFFLYAHLGSEKEAKKALNKSSEYWKRRAEIIKDKTVSRESRRRTSYNNAWAAILFGKYELARKNLKELKKISNEIKSPTALYGYFGLLAMTTQGEGDHEAALEFFNKSDPSNTYFQYYKAIALKSAGKRETANHIFKEISSTNFSYWQLGLVRSRAKQQLQQG